MGDPRESPRYGRSVTDFSYRLVCLTHGDSATLTQALAAFDEHVTPAPTETMLVIDAATQSEPVVEYIRERQGAAFWSPVPLAPAGFCAATKCAWALGAQPGVTHCFYLEHDFLVTRPVDLRELAAVLTDNYGLAQMSLMRDAYSKEEKEAGGLYQHRLRMGDYQTRRHYAYEDDLDIGDQMGKETGQYPWLSMSFLTTNPSLMRRDFMAEYPFVADEPHCEGKFGISLAKQGFEFGTWGDGSVFVRHVGTRDGFGY